MKTQFKNWLLSLNHPFIVQNLTAMLDCLDDELKIGAQANDVEREMLENLIERFKKTHK